MNKTNMNYNRKITEYFEDLKTTIDKVSNDEINCFINLLKNSRDDDKTIFVMGNGGSASTASHYVCDFNKGLSYKKDKKFKFISLNDNIPTIMAYANDVSYNDIFVEQLKNYFKEGDVVIGISGSGNSPNVIKAIKYANENNGITVGLTGFDGGKLKLISQNNIHVPINNMQIAEDLHLIINHCVMTILYDE
jgi:D-sedoheptulose 7-phosphate isomerase